MAEAATLKLIMEKGPKQGQTLEFTSRSTIKIGRVVRGNTFAIKDDGISSKHLSIHYESVSFHWVLIDLESSNGTILNGVEVVPLQPTVINDGDTIKIGELTSILVRIELGEMSQVRRSTRRRGKGEDSESNLSQCSGKSELGLGLESKVEAEVAPVKRNLRGRGRPRAADSKNEVIEEVNRDREIVEEVKKGNEVNVRRTRSLNKKGKGVEFNPTLPAVAENLVDDHSVENVISEQERCSEPEKMAASNNECLPSGSSEAVRVEMMEKLRVSNESNLEGEGSGGWKKGVDIHKVVDLKNMTLGDWFDYLEVYLPKQIYDETEAMILNMKQEAAKFHEFRLQQQNASDKGKKPME